MNITSIINEHLSAWYESIPGGRLTIAGVILTVIVLIVLTVYLSHLLQVAKMERKEKKEKRRRELLVNPQNSYEVVVRKWQD